MSRPKAIATTPTSDPIRPDYYRRGGIEAFEVIDAWGLDKDFYLASVLTYIARAGHKADALEDLKKARRYLDRSIARLEKEVPA